MQFKLIPLTDEEQENHDYALAAKMIGQQSDTDLVKWVERIDRLQTFEKFGLTSTFLYCFNVLELPRAKSHAVKSVAQKSREIPELHAAVEAGHSLWTIAKLVPHITNQNKHVWLDRLVTLDKAEVEEQISKISKRKKGDDIDKGEEHARLSGDLDNETLELFKQAQALVSKSKRKNASVNDVLKAALETFLEKNDPVRKADRALVRKKVFSTEKKPENTGKRVPLTAAEEHAVNKRDRGQCQAPHPDGEKCGSRYFTEIHHIVNVELGGANAPENLTTLCSGHHRVVHRGQWRPQSLRH